MLRWLRSGRVLFGWTSLVTAVSLALAWYSGWPRPIEATDQRQNRLDVAAPIPGSDQVVEQSFLAQHDGLSAVELLLVVYSAEAENQDEPSVLTLRLLDNAGEQIFASSWNVQTLDHNHPLRFTFPPLSDSAGKAFRLQLDGSPENQATSWAYSLDGYPRGALTINGQAQAGDLYFQTIYRYSLKAALRDLIVMVKQDIGLLLVLPLVLLLPGLVLLRCLPLSINDWGTVLGLAAAGSLAIVPLVWLWWTLLGGRWSGCLSWCVLCGLALLLVIGWRRRWIPFGIILGFMHWLHRCTR